MEHIGRGISQMTDEMVKFGLGEPEFSEGNDSFKLCLEQTKTTWLMMVLGKTLLI